MTDFPKTSLPTGRAARLSVRDYPQLSNVEHNKGYKIQNQNTYYVFLFLYFVSFIPPMGIFPRETGGRFPRWKVTCDKVALPPSLNQSLTLVKFLQNFARTTFLLLPLLCVFNVCTPVAYETSIFHLIRKVRHQARHPETKDRGESRLLTSRTGIRTQTVFRSRVQCLNHALGHARRLLVTACGKSSVFFWPDISVIYKTLWMTVTSLVPVLEH